MSQRPKKFSPPKYGELYRRPKEEPAVKRVRASTAKHYGRAWRKIRAAFLRSHPTCAGCGAPATEVDHRVALKKGGTNEWSNLMPYCKACHARKTVFVDGALGRKPPDQPK